MTNIQMADTIHIFYNPNTNVMASVQYRRDLELYEVMQWCDEGRSSISVMSMDRILDERKKGKTQWDFLGIL